MASFISYTLLVLILGAQLTRRSFLIRRRWLIFTAAVIAIGALETYYISAQYRLWLASDLTKYFLPPYRDFGYFSFYVLKRFLAPYLISLPIALIVSFLLFWFNRRFNFRFFYPEEPFLAAAAVFLVSYPAFLFYFPLLILLILIISIFLSWRRRPRRLSFRYLWVPTALFVIIISNWLAGFDWWRLLAV